MHSHCPTCGIKFDTKWLFSQRHVCRLRRWLFGPAAHRTLAGMAECLHRCVFCRHHCPTTLLAPLIFRYARLIWMHTDQLLDPRPSLLQELNFSQYGLTN
jgi:hypothetical protein